VMSSQGCAKEGCYCGHLGRRVGCFERLLLLLLLLLNW
jgi:hypothetical protein